LGPLSGHLRSIAVWLAASGLLAFAGAVITHRISTALYLLWFASPTGSLLIGFVLLFGGPLAILVAGIRKRRSGMIAGPLLLIPVAAIWSVAGNWISLRTKAVSIAQLDARTFSAPAIPHHLIAQEYSRSSDCDQLCQLILVSSSSAVAVGGSDFDRTIYRKISHAECLETQYVRHTIRFFGICAAAEPVQRIDDALMIETPTNLGAWEIFPGIDHEFDGMAYALVERLRGQDHLLGRWISGRLESGPFESHSIGQAFTREEFYRSAPGLRLEIEDFQDATWIWQGQEP
jgi:hypothetical protein